MKRIIQLVISIMLIISLTIVLVPMPTVSASAIFTVNASTLHLRNGPAAGYASLGTYPFGTQVDMLQHNTGANAFSQVRVRADGRTGWMSTQFLAPATTTTPNPDTGTGNIPNQTNLNAFPASYRHLIQNMLNTRPHWVFVPFNTGLDWNNVIRNQTLPLAPGSSLVPATSHPSWIVSGATQGVEQGWAQASEAIVRYQMDPRNFLNETDVFQFEQLNFNANLHTVVGTDAVLNSTFMHSSRGRRLENGQTYAQAFVDIGRNRNISPFHLASRVRLEQGVNGTSPLISGTHAGFQGLFNYFNVGAFGATQQLIIERGLTRARTEGWTTRVASLDGGASFVASQYIARGQNTLYFQKFNVVPATGNLFRNQYMQNIFAPLNEGRNMRVGHINAGNINNNFVFIVPVFNNMPAMPEPFPGAVYNENNFIGVYDFEFYRNNNPDIANVFGGNRSAMLAHFVDHGMREGRRACITFDVHFYRNEHADLQTAFGDDLRAFFMHFLDYGMTQGRQGSAEFHITSYKNANADLRAVFGNDTRAYFTHFIRHGQHEGRIATGVYTLQNPITRLNNVEYSLVYDFETYQRLNPDLASVFGNDDAAMLRHFVNHGMREGRQSHPNFDVHEYRNANADLRAVFGNDLRAFIMHFINHGHRENRPFSPVLLNPITIHNRIDYALVYDLDAYLELNPDIYAVFGNDEVRVLAHFVNHGMREGRIASHSFDVHEYRNANPDLQAVFGNDLRAYFMHYINHGHSEGRTVFMPATAASESPSEG